MGGVIRLPATAKVPALNWCGCPSQARMPLARRARLLGCSQSQLRPDRPIKQRRASGKATSQALAFSLHCSVKEAAFALRRFEGAKGPGCFRTLQKNPFSPMANTLNAALATAGGNRSSTRDSSLPDHVTSGVCA